MNFLLINLAAGHVFPLLQRTPTRRMEVSPRVAGRPHGKSTGLDTSQTLPLYGNLHPLAEFALNVSIGTPPQQYLLQLDTGSVDTVVYSEPCDGCSHSGVGYYKCHDSTTCDPVICESQQYDCNENNCWQGLCPFAIKYGGGGEIAGPVTNEKFAIGDLGPVHASFGQIQKDTALTEPTAIDGIMGLAFPPLSSWGAKSVLAQLTLGAGIPYRFSMCLIPDAGVFEVGTDYSSHPDFAWTPVYPHQMWWEVYVEQVSLGGTPLDVSVGTLNEHDPIVDSGTTLIILPGSVWSALSASYRAMCNAGKKLAGICDAKPGEGLLDGKCIKMTEEELVGWPDFSVNLWKMDDPLVIPGNLTLGEYAGPDNKGFYCLSMQPAPASAGPIPLILGDALMSQYHVAFDASNGVGFAPLSTCPTV